MLLFPSVCSFSSLGHCFSTFLPLRLCDKSMPPAEAHGPLAAPVRLSFAEAVRDSYHGHRLHSQKCSFLDFDSVGFPVISYTFNGDSTTSFSGDDIQVYSSTYMLVNMPANVARTISGLDEVTPNSDDKSLNSNVVLAIDEPMLIPCADTSGTSAPTDSFKKDETGPSSYDFSAQIVIIPAIVALFISVLAEVECTSGSIARNVCTAPGAEIITSFDFESPILNVPTDYVSIETVPADCVSDKTVRNGLIDCVSTEVDTLKNDAVVAYDEASVNAFANALSVGVGPEVDTIELIFGNEEPRSDPSIETDRLILHLIIPCPMMIILNLRTPGYH
ncbi:unnamed protein product [Cuscuta epithymum]|uniref:Uncharacterized protein n=1 Tax=Cuscuta epithymum TaxID=186058 RepID=A0AAV0ETV0_9ASTE|nr:unnamed protein product [Cuscuta epithymum]